MAHNNNNRKNNTQNREKHWQGPMKSLPDWLAWLESLYIIEHTEGQN